MRHGNKLYWRLPFKLGELQFGLISRDFILWYRGNVRKLNKPNTKHIQAHWGSRMRNGKAYTFDCGMWQCPYRERDGA